MQSMDTISYDRSKAAAKQLGYTFHEFESCEVAFYRHFGDETYLMVINPKRPEAADSCWKKKGHEGRYTGPLDVDAETVDRAALLDSFELSAAYARDIGNERSALLCEEYRERNVRDLEERKAATGGRWVAI